MMTSGCAKRAKLEEIDADSKSESSPLSGIQLNNDERVSSDVSESVVTGTSTTEMALDVGEIGDDAASNSSHQSARKRCQHAGKYVDETKLSDSDYLPQGSYSANERSRSEFQGFDELILNFMKEHSVPGISLVISNKGAIRYTQCYGYATRGVLLHSHHLFRIASITKIITAIAVLHLYEEGKLKLNDRVFGTKGILSQYSPTVSGDRRVLRITVRHLLSNSGGWDRDVVGDPVFWKHVGQEMGVPEPVSSDVLIQFMMSQKLQFTPGSKYSYSNLGYLILGRVVEKCSGDSYEVYVQNLLKKLGVVRMQLGKTFKDAAHPDEVEYFASPQYRCVDSIYPGIGKVVAPYGSFAMEAGDADGGWIASPSDLIAIMEALEGLGEKRLLKPDTFKLMLERPSYAKGSCWYGLGLEVSWYRKAWEHGGHLDGATGCLTRHKNGITWAILSNYWPTDTDYTSLVSYGLTKVKGWMRITTVHVDHADAATLDRKYCVKIKLRKDEFPKFRQIFATRCYRMLWFDAYQVRDEVFINVIWVKDGLKGLCHLDVTAEQLQNTIIGAKLQGYSPIHIDTYVSRAELKTLNLSEAEGFSHLRFAILFVEGLESTVVHHDIPFNDLAARTKELKAQGYYINCQRPYHVNNKCYVAALFVKSISSGHYWPKPQILLHRYQGEFDRQARYGHLPSYLKSYTEGESVYLSAIFSQPGPYLYTAEHDMSKYRVIGDLLLVAQKKFYPLCICGYEVEGGHKFAVVCVKEVPPKK